MRPKRGVHSNPAREQSSRFAIEVKRLGSETIQPLLSTVDLPFGMQDFLLDLRYRLEYAALRLITGLVRAVPLEVAVDVSARAWRRLAPYDRRHKRALQNLAIAFPEKSAAEREAIALAMWENLGAHNGRDDGHRPHHPGAIAHRHRQRAHVQPLSRQARRGHRRDVAREQLRLAIWPLTEAGKNPAAIYRSVRIPTSTATCAGCGGISTPAVCWARGAATKRPRLSRGRSRGFVRQGGRLGIVCDLHDRARHPGALLRPACAIGGGAGADRAPDGHPHLDGALLARRPRSRFKIEIKELKVPRTTNQADDVRWITAAMQKQFEDWVRETPEQWMWSNRRWS